MTEHAVRTDGGLELGERTVAIVGLGYVGLPIALLFAGQGFTVLGLDADRKKISSLQIGRSYLPDIADQQIASAISSGRFSPCMDYERLGEASAIIICVPTPLSAGQLPDLSYLENAAIETGKALSIGQLVVLESSTYPGTTTEVLVPILERESGLTVGKDFHVGYSPERIDPGNKQFAVRDIPKVVSGVTSDCLRRTESIYCEVFQSVVRVSSPEVAEMTKLLENTYRLVNISFINEMAILCDGLGIDLWEAIEAAKTKSFGYSAFYPGPGVGGHCIPVDPQYLQWRAGEFGLKSGFIELSERVNQSMIDYLADRVEGVSESNCSTRTALIYGAAYKKDVDDIRESPSIALMERLQDRGFIVSYHDPLVREVWVNGKRMRSVALTEERLSQSDCVIIMTDHTGIPIDRIVSHARGILDTRNVTAGYSERHIDRVGSGNFGNYRKNPHR
ncbi:nucleotide sugar dehydrogenase [Cohnella herbarum]|uniref:nucleotide sugar dehydrogenase n=1 Tax=Cohnella herbarum TaxID=2728023 RepID=UPI0020C33A46|nr:nucleotide sugar dehydrogenase [Cohnella herbarum]